MHVSRSIWRLSLAGLMVLGVSSTAAAADTPVSGSLVGTATVVADLGGNFIVSTTDNQSTGTGVIQSFVRLDDNDGMSQGYNTDARPLQFDENNSPTFTRSLALSAVPIVTISGTAYREFLLDINQQDVDPLLALNQIQIFLTNNPSITGAVLINTEETALSDVAGTFGAQATEIFRYNDVNDTETNQITLNYALNSGSGAGDLFVYIPNSLFLAGFTHVVLYSQFGTPPGSADENAGFEEWAVRTPTTLPVIPEPTSLLLLGTGLGLVGQRLRRRKRG